MSITLEHIHIWTKYNKQKSKSTQKNAINKNLSQKLKYAFYDLPLEDNRKFNIEGISIDNAETEWLTKEQDPVRFSGNSGKGEYWLESTFQLDIEL